MCDIGTTTSVITALAHTGLTGQCAEEARRLLSSHTDWDGLVELSKFHHVVPLVCSGIHALQGHDLLPDGVADELEQLSRSVACNNMMLAGELARILRALSCVGVEVIPIRGVAMAAWLYGDVTLRMFGDIDIMVPRHKVAVAVEGLAAIGTTPKIEYPGAKLRKLLRTDCEWHFSSPSDTHVELHWRVFPRKMRFWNFERGLWDRSIERTFMGVTMRVLSPSDEAIMMAIHHGGKHRWSEMRHVCDFAALVRSDILDWSEVTERARSVGALRYILTGLSAVKTCLGIEPPAEMAQVVASDPVAADYGVDLSTRLFGGHSNLIYDTPVIYYMKHRQRLRDKLRYLPWLTAWTARGIFEPTEKELRYLPLPRGLRFLLVPFRLVRLSAKYAARLFPPNTARGSGA